MRVSILGNLKKYPGGALEVTEEGGEDLRSLLIATAGVLWPSGIETWFPNGGFHCELKRLQDGHDLIVLQSEFATQGDFLPVVSMFLALETALRSAGELRIVAVVAQTAVAAAGEPVWSRLNWASTIARGLPPDGSAELRIEGLDRVSAEEMNVVRDRLQELIALPERSPTVEACENLCTVTVNSVSRTLLSVGRIVDGVRGAVASIKFSGRLRISVTFVDGVFTRAC